MGLDYSFVFVTRSEGLGVLLAELEGHRWPDPDPLQIGTRVCWSLLFPPDDALTAFCGSRLAQLTVGDRVRVGCIWTTVAIAEPFARVDCTAATTNMSLLFADNPVIHRVFAEIARKAAVSCLALDVEGPDLRTLWPEDIVHRGAGEHIHNRPADLLRALGLERQQRT